MDWIVIWEPILSASGSGWPQLRSVKPSSVLSQAADSAPAVIKAGFPIFLFQGNITWSVIKVQLSILSLGTFSCSELREIWQIGLRSLLSAQSLTNNSNKKTVLLCLSACAPLDVFSMQSAFVCVGGCFHKDLHTCMCVWSCARCRSAVYLNLLLLLLFTICSVFGLLLFLLCRTSFWKDHQSWDINVEERKIHPLFFLFAFSPLPSESVAKQLSRLAREPGICYQAPSYLCEQFPRGVNLAMMQGASH